MKTSLITIQLQVQVNTINTTR